MKIIKDEIKETQCERLLKHFRNGGTITSLQAYLDFGITQLGRCIRDLENEGHIFNRSRITLKSGKTVCEYSLERDRNEDNSRTDR